MAASKNAINLVRILTFFDAGLLPLGVAFTLGFSAVLGFSTFSEKTRRDQNELGVS